MYWYVPCGEFNYKAMQELENYTLDKIMDVLEELAIKYSQKDKAKEEKKEQPVDDENDTPDCDGDCEHCKFNEEQPIEFDIIEFDIHMHDSFIDTVIDYLDDKSEDEYDAHDQDEYNDQDENDAVNHPSYYCGNIEVIDFIEDKNLGYHLGNAVKYISRAGKKHEQGMTDKEKEIQDLQKAIWFINRKIKLLKNED